MDHSSLFWARTSARPTSTALLSSAATSGRKNLAAPSKGVAELKAQAALQAECQVE
ncbi:Uncharacterized protein DAT39_013642 [Clarias magur]|uniref:Uncharacterized protein n=1 Tax=Clarias magur TaxID=1594786 RepID=A0A8J4TJM7_CLAMG|nr:Uncharacterized protein DAT39_013642 [Clarias magur]